MRYNVSYGWPLKPTASWQNPKVILFLFQHNSQARELEISLPRALEIKLVKTLIPSATSPLADLLTSGADSGDVPYLTMVAPPLRGDHPLYYLLPYYPIPEDPQNCKEV